MGDHQKAMLAKMLGAYDTMALATLNKEGDVDCASVYFAFDEECRLYFTTVSTSRKSRNLAENDRVSATMDDRQRAGLQLYGRAVKLAGDEAAQAKKRLLSRHPQVARWFDSPHSEHYRLTPEACFVIDFGWGFDWRVPLPL